MTWLNNGRIYVDISGWLSNALFNLVWISKLKKLLEIFKCQLLENKFQTLYFFPQFDPLIIVTIQTELFSANISVTRIHLTVLLQRIWPLRQLWKYIVVGKIYNKGCFFTFEILPKLNLTWTERWHFSTYRSFLFKELSKLTSNTSSFLPESLITIFSYHVPSSYIKTSLK